MQHLAVVRPYIQIHMKQLREANSKKGTVALTKEHNAEFSRWLKDYWYEREPINREEETVRMLSQEPDSKVVTWQSYDVNGYTFYTEAQDRRSTYQNCGVTQESRTGHHGKKCRYYGVIEEIWELDYTVTKIPMFRVRWAKDVRIEDMNTSTMVIPPPIPMKSRQVKSISPKDEPWVLAKQLAQVFYITDPKNKKRVVVRKGKRSIVGVDGVVDEEDYDQFDDPDTEEEDVDDRTSKRHKSSQDACPYIRRSHDESLTYTTKKIRSTIEKRVEDDEI